MKISYLINQYPKVSHSFIRREILALEQHGFQIQRIALRGWDAELVDEKDVSELQKTRYVLQRGLAPLIFTAIQTFLSIPSKFFKALLLTLNMSQKSEKNFFFHLVYLAEACQIFGWLKAHQSQHLHAHFGTNSAEIAMLASLLSGVPYSFTVHGPEEFDKPQAIGLNTTINLAKFVVAISSFGRSQLYRWASLSDWTKIKVVHCGLEAGFYNVPIKTLPKNNNFVCVGRLCEQKGQVLLVEAAKRLDDEGLDFQLTLAGDGEMRADVEVLVSKYALQNKVKITGWISSEEVRAYILNSQALVLPSFGEGLPVVIMEAMSLRRPVISTYIAGIPELIKPQENGWLCAAGDLDDLTRAMREALATPHKVLQKMGDAAYARVTLRHNIDIEAAKLGELIKTSSIC